MDGFIIIVFLFPDVFTHYAEGISIYSYQDKNTT